MGWGGMLLGCWGLGRGSVGSSHGRHVWRAHQAPTERVAGTEAVAAVVEELTSGVMAKLRAMLSALQAAMKQSSGGVMGGQVTSSLGRRDFSRHLHFSRVMRPQGA